VTVATIGAQVMEVFQKNPPAPHAQGQAQARAPQSHGSLHSKSPTNNPTNPSTLDHGFLTWDPGQVADEGPVPGAADAADTPQAFAPKAGGPVMNEGGFKGNPEDGVFWDKVGNGMNDLAWAVGPFGVEELAVGVFRRLGPEILGGARAAKAVSFPAWRKVTVDVAHILERHVPGGRLSAGRTVFPSTMNDKGIMRAIRGAYESGTKVGVQGADRVLLRGQGGGLTIEMWFNKVTNTIETAYPVTP